MNEVGNSRASRQSYPAITLMESKLEGAGGKGQGKGILKLSVGMHVSRVDSVCVTLVLSPLSAWTEQNVEN